MTAKYEIIEVETTSSTCLKVIGDRVRVRVSSLVFVEKKVGGSKLSVLRVSSCDSITRNNRGQD